MHNIHPAAPSRASNAILIYVTGDFTRLRSGSHVRFSQMIAYALEEFDRVIVYSFRENDEDPWTPEAEDRFRRDYGAAELVIESRGRRLKALFRLKNLALMVSPRRAVSILRLRIARATPHYESIMQGPNAPAMLVNFADGLCELNGIDLPSVSIDTIDSKYVRYAKYRRLRLTDWKSLLRLRSEIGMLERVRTVIAISQAEAGFFRVLFGQDNVLLVPVYRKPNIVDESTDGLDKFDLLFVGANNLYNRDGLTEFIRQNEDLLRKVTLKVAGSVCADPELQDIAGQNANIVLMGWVDDLASVYGEARIVIAPVDGTGLNIKVVEALEHGKPVVASSHARHALPGDYRHCVFPIDVEKILNLLSDPAALHAAEEEAREYALGPVLRGDVDQLTVRLKEHCPQTAANSPSSPRGSARV